MIYRILIYITIWTLGLFILYQLRYVILFLFGRYQFKGRYTGHVVQNILIKYQDEIIDHVYKQTGQHLMLDFQQILEQDRLQKLDQKANFNTSIKGKTIEQKRNDDKKEKQAEKIDIQEIELKLSKAGS